MLQPGHPWASVTSYRKSARTSPSWCSRKLLLFTCPSLLPGHDPQVFYLQSLQLHPADVTLNSGRVKCGGIAKGLTPDSDPSTPNPRSCLEWELTTENSISQIFAGHATECAAVGGYDGGRGKDHGGLCPL